jgi:monoamine oxidase
MNSQEDKDGALGSYPQRNLESPFLEEELFVGDTQDEWEPRLVTLQSVTPFQHAFEQGRPTLIEPEDLEEESVEEEVRLQRPSGQPLPLPLSPDCQKLLRNTRVAVVGGGLGGLMAARRLVEHGIKVTVYEARSQVGGRVLSNHKFSQGRITEEGAELIGSFHTKWLGLAREYGLAVVSRMDPDLYQRAGLAVKLILDKPLPLSMAEFKQLEDAVRSRVLVRIALLAKLIRDPSQPWKQGWLKKYDGMSVQDALPKYCRIAARTKGNKDEQLWKMLDFKLVNDEVAPLDKMNFLGLLCKVRGGQGERFGEGLKPSPMGYWDELEIFRCADGCQQLATKMEVTIKEKPGCKVELNLMVRDIDISKDKVKLTWVPVRGEEPDAGPGQIEVFEYVILTIPPSVWGDVTIKVAGEAPKKKPGVMGMAPAVKFFSNVDKRFWIEKKAAPYGGSLTIGQVWEGTDNQTQTEVEILDPRGGRRKVKQGIVLSVFAGPILTGPAGPRAPTQEEFMTGLEKLYPGYTKNLIQPPLFSNWPEKRFIMTGYVSPTINQIFGIGEQLSKLWYDRLFFAGEHTEMGFFGYMEGALRSGERAANALIAHACGLTKKAAPASSSPPVLTARPAPIRAKTASEYEIGSPLEEHSSTDYAREAESPFLHQELFVKRSEEEWEPRAAALAAESPFVGAIEERRSRFDEDQLEEEEAPDELEGEEEWEAEELWEKLEEEEEEESLDDEGASLREDESELWDEESQVRIPEGAEWSGEAEEPETFGEAEDDFAEDRLELVHEQPLEERFDPANVPPDVADALRKKEWSLALQLAIQAGWRDENELTNLVFFARYGLPNQPLDKKNPKFNQLSAAWARILNEEVWRAIQVSAENTDLVVSGEEVTDHHRRFFRGNSGKRLKKLVEAAAREVDLNPGLLGTIMMAETRRPQSYLSTEKVSSYHIGADDFYEGRAAIKARVPAYAKVKWDKNQTPIVHDNDAKTNPRKVKTILFNSGPDAVLATAVYVKFREVRLREIAAELKGDFDNLPLATRFALTRMAMAAGTAGATPFLKNALKGLDIFIRKAIPVRAYQTQRNATVRTAQAMHLSDWIFGIPVAPASQPEIAEESEVEERWDSPFEQDAAGFTAPQEPETEPLEETLGPDQSFAEAWTGESTEGAENLAGIGETGSVTPPAHMAFDHILLESLDLTTSAMVPGVVPATPAALTTPFFDASVAGTIPDPTLQQALTSLINSKRAYKNAGKNIAVSLVDLSGANKRSPKYAGFNDLTNFYGGSVNKITGLLGVYQLLAEANEFLKTKPTIGDVVGLESKLKILWTQAGIAAQHHPRVTMILVVQPGSPATATIRPELVARLRRISRANQNGSTPIVLLKFPYIGSTMLAHGLYSPANGGGLWTRSSYGAIVYLGQNLSLADWPTKENPYPGTASHNINAVSVAQFYTLAAQHRMIDEDTSKAVLGHLQTGGCTTVIDATALYASGQVATKCGIYKGWVHNTLHFKETATLREFVVVILTKNHTFGIMKDLFKDLVALVP